MIKSVTRRMAISLFKAIDNTPLGNLEGNTLASVVANLEEFRRVYESFNKMIKSLSDRLYKDIDSNTRMSFFEVVAKYEREDNPEKKKELYESLANYKDIMPLYEKHIDVALSLLNKEVEIDIEEVDANALIVGVSMANKDMTIREIRELFSIMIVELDTEDVESELEELLK